MMLMMMMMMVVMMQSQGAITLYIQYSLVPYGEARPGEKGKNSTIPVFRCHSTVRQ